MFLKQIKSILFYSVMVLLIGCNSSKNTSKKVSRYMCLDAVTSKAMMKKYKLEIPDNWCSYLDIHNELSYVPKSLLDLKENEYKNNLNVYTFNGASYKSKDIEEALRKHTVGLNIASEFNPVYVSEIHDIYGKYYIIKRKGKQNGDDILNLQFLYNYKNQDYLIDYSVLEKDYESYINEVIQVVSTFKILE